MISSNLKAILIACQPADISSDTHGQSRPSKNTGKRQAIATTFLLQVLQAVC
jgi:hypothetical protein